MYIIILNLYHHIIDANIFKSQLNFTIVLRAFPDNFEMLLGPVLLALLRLECLANDLILNVRVWEIAHLPTLDQVVHEHGDGHRTDAPRYRSDKRTTLDC
jgi:hypothetical protein